jgi:hypoxanthine phosphoribosyltransferase
MPKGARILLVDDVSVSGQTLALARSLLKGYEVITFTLKGKADFVLFPEITACVNWPWKQ